MTLDVRGLRVSRDHLLLGAVRYGIDQAVAGDMQRAIKDPDRRNLSRRGKCPQCLSQTHDSISVSGDCAQTVSVCGRCGLMVRWEGGPGVGVNEGTYWVRLESTQ